MKRWDDPAVSWDDRARVARRVFDSYAIPCASMESFDSLSVRGQADQIAGICGVRPLPSKERNVWHHHFADALRAEGFEVPE